MTTASLSWGEVSVFAASPPAPLREASLSFPQTPATVDDSDDLLLHRIGGGDQAAFRMLVERHADRAFGLALRILHNRADAEDVVQDTMLKVWVHRGRWEDGRAKFSTWLYRVVTNRCIDVRRQPRAEDVDGLPEVQDAKPDALANMERHAASDMLEAAMARLPEQQRIAIILSYHQSLSNGEIADVMETTVFAVESLLKRGRQHLRKLLQRTGDDMLKAFTED